MRNWRTRVDYPKNWRFHHFLGAARHIVLTSGTWTAFRLNSCILIAMQVSLVHIGQRPGARDRADALTAEYLQRCSPFARCNGVAFRSQDALFEWLDKQRGRTPATAVLCDTQGRQMGSEAFAGWISSQRDRGAQHLVLAVGPPDGWSDAARKRADLLLSLGAMTLPHALARLILAEQLYRAFTILAGHPYHCGH